ncbi:hypothetical protein D3C85_1041990 [compost metagenome]
MQGLGGQRAVDGGHLLPDQVTALGLVAVHRQLAVLAAQQRGRLADQHIHGRVVRHGEGGQQLGQGPRAGPLVIGQHGDGLRRAAQLLRAGLHDHVDAGAHGLLQVGDVGVVGGQVQRRDAADFTGNQAVEAQLDALREGRVAGDVDFDVVAAVRRAVAQAQRTDDGDRILDGRVTERRVGLDVDGDGRKGCSFRLRSFG